MRYFSITHVHEYGSDSKVIKCEGDFAGEFSRVSGDDGESDFIFKHVGYRYEPEKGEEIYIEEIVLDDISLVTL